MLNTIKFKSIPENWHKEFIGIKCNTIRKYDNDIRFNIIDEWILNPYHLKIEIENTRIGDTFTRDVKDVTIFMDVFYIISW